MGRRGGSLAHSLPAAATEEAAAAVATGAESTTLVDSDAEVFANLDWDGGPGIGTGGGTQSVASSSADEGASDALGIAFALGPESVAATSLCAVRDFFVCFCDDKAGKGLDTPRCCQSLGSGGSGEWRRGVGQRLKSSDQPGVMGKEREIWR